MLHFLCHQDGVTAENAGQRLHLRVERQTLSRLPRTGAVLFTIRTHMKRLDHFEGRPDAVRHPFSAPCSKSSCCCPPCSVQGLNRSDMLWVGFVESAKEGSHLLTAH